MAFETVFIVRLPLLLLHKNVA